jgi:hypothetical protein
LAEDLYCKEGQRRTRLHVNPDFVSFLDPSKCPSPAFPAAPKICGKSDVPLAGDSTFPQLTR